MKGHLSSPQIQFWPALKLGQDAPVPRVEGHAEPRHQPPDVQDPVREAGAGAPPGLPLHPGLELGPEAGPQVSPDLLPLKIK